MEATESPPRTAASRAARGLRSAYTALVWTSGFFAFVYVAGVSLGGATTGGATRAGGPFLWLWWLSLLILGVELVRRVASGNV